MLLQVTALERDGTQRLLSGADCGLSYRHSRFSEGDLLICRAVFALPEGNREEIAGRMADFAQRRREKQPLEYPSAGLHLQAPPGHFAAALIDQCGLKGRAVGGAQVSEKHAASSSTGGRHLRRCPGAGGPGAAGGAGARPAWSWSWRSGCWGKMDGYTREELDEALTAVQSIIHKCERPGRNFRGAPPATPCWSGG